MRAQPHELPKNPGQRSGTALHLTMAVFSLAIAHAVHADTPGERSRSLPVTMLHVFHDRRGDASEVTVTREGVIYGAFPVGGPSAAGSIYRMLPDGTLRILHTFSGPDGIFPSIPPVEAADGAIYGAAQFGSDFDTHCGIYRITRDGAFAIVYVLPSAIGDAGDKTLVVQIKGRSPGRLYKLAGDPFCRAFTASVDPSPKGGPTFSVVGTAFECCHASSDWVIGREQLAEQMTQLVDPHSEEHRNSCNPQEPTQALSGERFGAISCQIRGDPYVHCFIYRIDKSNTVSIAYPFNVPVRYCRFAGPLVAGDDGNLYGVIFDYATPYVGVFRVDVVGRGRE